MLATNEPTATMAPKEKHTKRTIAVLGAKGRMGIGIAQNLARAGYDVVLAGDGKADLTPVGKKRSSLTARLGLRYPKARVRTVRSSREASWEADIILFALPYVVQAEAALKIRDVATGKVVVSATNPLNKTCDGLLTPSTTSAAEELAFLLPHSKVVKAFNTIFASDVEQPAIVGKTVDVFVAGDDEQAVSTVMKLVKEAGFNPLFVGQLTMSRTLENMMVLLINLSARNHYAGPVGWKVVHEKPEETRLDRQNSRLNSR